MTLQAQLIIAATLVVMAFISGCVVTTWHMKASELNAVNKAVAEYKAEELKTSIDAAVLNADAAARAESARLLTVKRRTDLAQNSDLAKCKLSPDVLRDFNAALTGAAAK